ncbi:MAG: UDP-3-O-(3-hydroxymyristoyl)glucosamine N-acyltransferase [Oligoflexia bacterium]|nr:UDP-3-O-(3-hydroxymyristoyl)glucosamine N-acyltransferase [Oligoflexia bacterium]
MKLTAAQISEKCGAVVKGDSTFVVTGVGDPKTAAPDFLCFAHAEKYLAAIESSPSQIWLITQDLFDRLSQRSKDSKTFLITPKPYVAFVQVVKHFHPPEPVKSGIHPQAFVHPEARIHKTAEIGPFVFVGADSEIGAGCILKSGSYVGQHVKIGDNCLIHAGARVLDYCVVGHRVILHPGACVGGDGFGFIPHEGAQLKIPQVGKVILGDDVEVGCNSTIDRGTVGDTIVGEGTKIDNLVQIGHNCIIGKHNILCAFVGLSGNTTVGDYCLFAGQSATKGHLKIGSFVQIGGQTGVSKDLPSKVSVKGYPAQPVTEYLKNQALVMKLPEIYKRLLSIEKLVKGTNDAETN